MAGAAEGAAPQGEAHWALRLFLEALARRRPLVVVIEDGHWAHAALLDLVEYVARWSTAAPLVLLVLARPDLVELRPGWATPPAPGTRLVLEPLRDADAHALVAALPGAETLSGETRQRVVALAEGNPLYAEQLLAHAAEGGSLADPPPTVEALIASRLDRLDPAERDVLDRAAVLGRDFSPEAVAALGDATSTLHALERGGLVDGSRFHHALVRDVAYGEITKARRADLHERAAGWLERHEGADEVVGYHLEQAAQYVRDTGGDPGRARRLATDAGERLGDAGLRAWHGDEAAATAGLLTRATTLLPRQGLRRRELLCELGIALRTAGDLAGAKAALAAAVAAAEEARDRRIALRARIELEGARLFGGGSSSPDALLALADAAIPVFEAIEDDRALGRAFLLVGLANGAVRGRCADWMEAADRALDHYLRAGLAALHVPRISGRRALPRARAGSGGRRPLRGADGGERRPERPRSGGGPARGPARAGRARRRGAELADEAARMHEELGQAVLVTRQLWIRSQIELLAGDADAAVAVLRKACERLRERGEAAQLTGRAADLAEALVVAGEPGEALEWAARAEELASEADVWARFGWRRARARALARLGECDPAEVLAREALAAVDVTDALNERAATRTRSPRCSRRRDGATRPPLHVPMRPASTSRRGTRPPRRGSAPQPPRPRRRERARTRRATSARRVRAVGASQCPPPSPPPATICAAGASPVPADAASGAAAASASVARVAARIRRRSALRPYVAIVCLLTTVTRGALRPAVAPSSS